MSAEVIITKIDSDRKERAESLRVQISYLDLELGIVRGKVLSSKGTVSYPVEIQLESRTCRCTCKDFERRHKPCKHLAAMALILRHVIEGQTIRALPKVTFPPIVS